ncbi:VOC family protein [Actinomadura livida]|uniref:Putative glyoxalase superfamily protein PhnB n=1 Tax=Actinomadura livida TaxID=79909 RepID=A0A7W7IKH9_9ACTN|nr:MULTISPECIES: VOC family protein [Actinomadura]MBB4778779.1 putative glyoxalase superfamily protein PhnB [Actinomadura catellatispora]GGU36539.1 glyoxalase [Actinomadura livida]
MASTEVQPVPDGCTSVAPWIVTRDSAKAIDFIVEAFGGEELFRVPNEDGSVGHAEVRIGDSVVLLFDAKDTWPDTPALLRLYIEDVDTVFAKALKAGAVAVTELSTAAWGDRGGRVRDPLGNIWWLMERVENVSDEEAQARWNQPQYAASMRDAQQSLDRVLGRVP